jgi:hypothetical protein
MDGHLQIIEPGDVLKCRCGKVKDGAKRGPKGGRQWAWRLADGTRVCGKDCPALGIIGDQASEDDARGDWEAQQAMEKYG